MVYFLIFIRFLLEIFLSFSLFKVVMKNFKFVFLMVVVESNLLIFMRVVIFFFRRLDLGDLFIEIFC